MTRAEATAATSTARRLGRPSVPLKLPSKAKNTPAIGALKPAARPAATPAATRARRASGTRPPRSATQSPRLPPLSTLGPSGPSEAPLPRLREAARSRRWGSLGVEATAPSAMAIRLGRPGPRLPLSQRSSPTASPPRVGTTTTGQRASQSGGLGRVGLAGAGAASRWVRKPMPSSPSCSSDFSGVPLSTSSGGRGMAVVVAAVAIGDLAISSSPSTNGP